MIQSAEDYRRLRGEPMGDALVRLLAESDVDDVELDHPQARGPARDVTLGFATREGMTLWRYFSASERGHHLGVFDVIGPTAAE